MPAERLIESRRIYKGRAIGVKVDSVEKESGRVTTREVVQHSDCVAILAIDAARNVLLVRQFRHAVGRELLEIPAGGIEPEETPEQAVCRELREESGYMPRQVVKLGGFFSAPGYCTEYLHLFLATELEHSPLEAEDTESIELVRVRPADVRQLVVSGEICDAKSVAALASVRFFNNVTGFFEQASP